MQGRERDEGLGMHSDKRRRKAQEEEGKGPMACINEHVREKSKVQMASWVVENE